MESSAQSVMRRVLWNGELFIIWRVLYHRLHQRYIYSYIIDCIESFMSSVEWIVIYRLSYGKLYMTYYMESYMESYMALQITSLVVVSSTVYSDADQRKLHSSASLAFVWENSPGLVNSPHKGPGTRKMFPVDDVIMDSHMESYLTWILCFESCVSSVIWRVRYHPWYVEFSNIYLTHWRRNEIRPFCRRQFQMHFLEWKCIDFD